MGRARQTNFKLRADSVNLSLDGIACDGALGPSLGHHGAQPNILRMKERDGVRCGCRDCNGVVRKGFTRRLFQCQSILFRQLQAMQSEMWGARNRAACKGGLELRAGF